MGQAARYAVPAARGGDVSVARLDAMVMRGVEKPLMLITGPFGSGKTTLAASVARKVETRDGWVAAWIPATVLDSDLSVFGRRVVEALQEALGERCAAFPELSAELNGPCFDWPAWAHSFSEWAVAEDVQVLCVVNNAQMLTSEGVVSFLEGFVGSATGNVHLVLAGRWNPGISLSRFRLNDSVEEVRASDLALTEQESIRFLREQGVKLPASAVHEAHQLTLGWVAGLQMLSNAVKEKRSGFALEDFKADDQWIVDLLQEEIMPGLSDEAQQAMLRTCLLDRLCKALFEELTEIDRGGRVMHELTTANVLVPLRDDETFPEDEAWFRYHPLFTGALRHIMFSEVPSLEVREAALVAVDWYESAGRYGLAIKTALAQGEYTRAFDLMSSHLYAILAHTDSSVLPRWLEGLPHPHREDEYLYFLINAWANFIAGKTKRAQIWLQQAESRSSDSGLSVYRGANCVYQTVKVGTMAFAGEYHRTIELGSSLLDNLGGPQLFLRCTIMHNMGEAFQRLGRYQEAYEYFMRARVNAEIAGRRTIELLCACEISWLQYAQGQLDASSNTAMRALASCSDEERRASWSVGLLHVALARVYLCWDEVDKALEHLSEAFRMLGPTTNCDGYLEARVVLAKCKRAHGEMEDAYDILVGAYELLKTDKVPRGVNLLILTVFAESLVDMGQVERARSVLDEARLQTCQEDAFYQVAESCVAARIDMAEGRFDEALKRLADARSNALLAGLALQGHDCLVFSACALFASGSRAEAVTLMSEALDEASDEGHVHAFRRGVPLLDALVYEIAHPANSNLVLTNERRKARKFAEELMEREMPIELSTDKAGAGSCEDVEILLSDRERQVYRLLKQGKTRRQISEELGISLNTVRTHVRSIYEKTGVHDRSLL